MYRYGNDRPFGGGEGMVLKPEPLFDAVESLLGQSTPPAPSEPDSIAVVLLSASGKLFRQAAARRLAGLDRIVLLCGRYEGVDERVAQHLATEELSIGDFVLSGGELAAALIIDAVTRLLPGALGNEASALQESFSDPRAANPLETQTHDTGAISPDPISATPLSAGPQPLLLDFPHYTRPAEFRGWAVPEVLLGGNHEEIRRWRQRMALEKTRRNRPDLLANSDLGAGD
jgi:tRNA (guanine37-N1)-methyltransferase